MEKGGAPIWNKWLFSVIDVANISYSTLIIE